MKFSLTLIALSVLAGCGSGGGGTPPQWIPSFSTTSSATTGTMFRTLGLKDTSAEPSGSAKLAFAMAKDFLSRGSTLDRVICAVNAAKATGVASNLFDGTTQYLQWTSSDMKIKVEASGGSSLSSTKLWVCSTAPSTTQSGYIEGRFSSVTQELIGKATQSSGSDRARLRLYGSLASDGSWTSKKIEMQVDAATDTLLAAEQVTGYMKIKAIRGFSVLYGAIYLTGNAYVTAAEGSSKNSHSPIPNPAYSNYRIGQGSAYTSSAGSLMHWDDSGADTATPSVLTDKVLSADLYTSSDLQSQLAQVPFVGFEVWDCTGSGFVDLDSFNADASKKATSGAKILGRDVSNLEFGDILVNTCS